MKRRVADMAEGYAALVTSLKRQWDAGTAEEFLHRYPADIFRQMMKDIGSMTPGILGVPYKRDVGIAVIQLMNNIRYAQANENKYLLREDIWEFPIMNYHLNEGPYEPPASAVFGGHDYHLIVSMQDKLVLFYRDFRGLEVGNYVEVVE